MWIVLVAAVSYFVYRLIIKPLGYWKERNVPYNKGWPIVGSFASIIFRKKTFIEITEELYSEFPDRRYNGIFSFYKPQVLIRDPELIKQVTIKDFDYFMDRTSAASEKIDPLLSKNLVALQGQRWREMRATLSPSFTSSKMRFMFTLIAECAEQFTNHFEKQELDTISVEMKDIFSRFTNDAIATAAFGVTVDSLSHKENEFFTMGKESSNITSSRGLRLVGYILFPALMKFLKISIFPAHLTEFFTNIIRETIEVRETKGVVRPDMIHLLLEARRGKLSHDEDHSEASQTGYAVIDEPLAVETAHHQKVTLTDEDITAQALIFFFAGFETSSTLMCFMGHELAVNPDVQEKLQAEIDETLQHCGGKITYEDVLKMKYLDMVVSESLRKWPPGIMLERICLKDYTIKPELPMEEETVIEKGMSVAIPVVAIHRDSKYFPNPEKFDPERFSEENKISIVPFTYIPFGVGPRSCIASRFALMETKILFFHLLSKFDLIPTEKTTVPLVLSKRKLTLAPDGGFWLGLRKRNAKRSASCN